MKKIHLMSGGVVFLLLIVLGVYFYSRGSGLDNLILQKQKLENDISLAKNKLDKEQQILETLKKGPNISAATTTIIQNQIKQVSALLSQTDFMFSDPTGTNPKIKIKESPASLALNAQRKRINLILKKWQEKNITSQVKEIDAKDGKQIEAEAEVIRIFVDNLSKIMDNLTVENSNLSSFQIKNYSTRLASLDSIDEVLVSIETTIKSSNNNTQTVVTPDKIVAQELVTNQTQLEIVILQNQLAQIEQQIQQLTPIPVSTTTPESSATISPSLENLDNYESSYIPYNKSEPIIVQPGPPRLIEGSNQY
jgi:hypothetical protein